MTQQHRIRAFALSLFAVLAACENEETTHPDAAMPADAGSFDGADAAGASALSIGLADALEADAAARYTEVGAETKIRTEAEAQLRSSGKLRDGVTVTVAIDEFRLRTKKQVTWGGMMTGGDFIGAMVSVHDGGKLVKHEKVTAVSIKGSIVGAGEEERLDRLVNELAVNIAALL